MGFYLNKQSDFESYVNDIIYVDKSELIKKTNFNFGKPSCKFMCVTRLRRSGKTMTLSMLDSYYSIGSDAKELFDELKISSDSSYLDHLNKHNVIWIDMSSVYAKYGKTFMENLTTEVIYELKEKWPNAIKERDTNLASAIQRVNDCTGERFIFLIDEWDVIFREEPRSPLCDEYIMLLRSLFKSSDVSSCVDLVYMTGILPIKRYSTQSTLNMFKEYNMLNPRDIADSFGFTEEEVKDLCSKHGADFATMKKWYDGYNLKGLDIYNPQSVFEAITSKGFEDFWASTSAIEAVTNYRTTITAYSKDQLLGCLLEKKST